MTTHSDTAFYSMGITIGNQIKKYGIQDIDYDLLFAGIQDALENNSNELSINPEVAKKIASWYVNNSVSRQINEYNYVSSNFLEENKTKPGIVETPEGIQYKIIKSGSKKKPNVNNKVEISYYGKLTDGTIFSGSGNQNVSFYIKNSIPGWKIILPMMSEGSEWEIYLPPDYAFGSKGTPTVPPNSVVIYRIKLVKIFN